MATHHRYTEMRSLSDCHASLAAFQNQGQGEGERNPNPLPNSSLLVDEASDVSKSVANANPNAAVFTLLPQSDEWGRAVWSLQNKFLESGKGLDWRFVAFHDPQDDDSTYSLDWIRKYMSGVMMEEHWDKCSAAGPATRPSEKFQEQCPPLKVLAFDGHKLKLPASVESALGCVKGKEMQQMIERVNNENNMELLNANSRKSGNAARGGGKQVRTQCRPVFSQPDDDMTLRSKAKSFVGSNKVKLVLTDESELWLQNASDQPVELGPCEIFGFNVGAFTEKKAGTAKTLKEKTLAFMLQRDTDMIVLVSGQTKQLCCFSDVACQAAQKSGLTEMSMEDHTVTQLMKDRKVSLTLERPWSRCHVLFFLAN
ncbi:unnamed protein product [Cladocopium goreaui]|uniref:Modification methylase ScrFIA n=1 Tax=Cladocopium goreaui TaxID=2562237 RepID=A0A9P1BR45_9DINO|nr:unnamed protein product [Cladocopium goreaui]